MSAIWQQCHRHRNRDAEAGADFNSVASQIERLRERVDNTLGKADHRILLAPIRESSRRVKLFGDWYNRIFPKI
jgi:hypothetical protein